MRSRAEIQSYQREYYRIGLKCDRDGMRRQWREAKRRQKARRWK